MLYDIDGTDRISLKYGFSDDSAAQQIVQIVSGRLGKCVAFPQYGSSCESLELKPVQMPSYITDIQTAFHPYVLPYAFWVLRHYVVFSYTAHTGMAFHVCGISDVVWDERP